MSIELLTTLKKYKRRILIETGTYEGRTTKGAVDIGFQKVYTIELQDRLYEEVTKKLDSYIKNGSVEIYKGDSREVLPKILQKIKEPSTILLDAHLDEGNYISGVSAEMEKCPLYDELEAIKNHPIKSHIILIDDVRIIGKIGWGKEVLLDILIKKIKEINENYNITYDTGAIESDILVAKI